MSLQNEGFELFERVVNSRSSTLLHDRLGSLPMFGGSFVRRFFGDFDCMMIAASDGHLHDDGDDDG